MRGLVANRVGVGRLAGDEIGLAAAAAEVAALLGTAAAGFAHPLVAAIAVEAGRVAPDPAEVVAAHARELEAGQHARLVAGERDAVGRDAQEHRADRKSTRLNSSHT